MSSPSSPIGAVPAARPVRATYRVQFNPGFGFDQAAGLAPYLARLGVSHLYASPLLEAAPGSTHGYDVVDPTRPNPELGGEDGHRRLVDALHGAGLGMVLDVVPNHMSIESAANRWWWDVLENGPSSRYALYFDVSWDPPEQRLRNLVLVPVLGDHYGRVLERGELSLVRAGGELEIRYFEHRFPVSPASLDAVLEMAAERGGLDALLELAEACRALPDLAPAQTHDADARHLAKQEIKARLATLTGDGGAAAEALDGVIDFINASPDRLDGLLDRQHYRLARWQAAGQDLDYRRFFDINTLAAVRVEEPEVFDATHELILRWADAGAIDGIRVDHPDGLRDPEAYFQRLHERAPQAWIVAEKILQPEERLPDTWPVAGTTGYEFMNRALGLFIDADAEPHLSRLFATFAGVRADWPELVREAKLSAIRDLLGADLRRLANIMVRACEASRRHRDFTRPEITDAIAESLAALPVYRTYVRPGDGVLSEADRAHIARAIELAKSWRPDLDPELFDYLAGVLLLEHAGLVEGEFVARYQQTSGPVMAKGVEDTAFYRFNRLVALNEVGGSPGRFGTPVADFHAACHEQSVRWPHAMLATSTHDTKRSEDVRARLALLTQIPERWTAVVAAWSQLNERYRTRELPDRNAEYALYQALVGAHPLPAARAAAYMQKAAREAKQHTSWLAPDLDYEAALRAFVEGVLADPEFGAELDGFVRPLVDPGWVTALSYKLLALAGPGVPDLYQGTELWDLSLVDPDNRRPVDYGLRRRLLDEVETMDVAEAWARRAEGLPKLLLVTRALRLRAEIPDAFAGGEYEPLPVSGGRARNLVAFARDGRAVALAPRLVLDLVTGAEGLSGWGDTTVRLPAGRWRDVLSGHQTAGGEVAVADLLARFPVGLLTR